MFVRDLLLSFAAPLLALPAASLAGAWARRARVELDAETHAAASFALVLVWLQAGGMVLGFAGALRALPALGWIAAGAIGAATAARRVSLPAFRPAHALLLLPLAGYLLLASVPPWDRDEMVYHLALPRQFALAGRYVRPDDNVFASLPLGWESAVSLLYAIGGNGEPLFNPRLLGAWTAMAAALGTTGLARAIGARAAWVAGPALLAIPTFVEFGASAYVEAYLVLLTTLSLGAVARVLAGEPRWLVPGAAFAGVAASVKYPGLAATAILVLLLLTDRRSDRAPEEGFFAVPENVRRGARFLAIALLVGCPFYVRNAIQRHNPFFPLAFDLFGGEGWDAVRSEAYWGTLRAYGGSGGLEGALTLPVRLFGERDLLHGLEGSIGPVAGAGVVAAVVLARRRPPQAGLPVLAVALFAGAWFLFWAFTVQQARFFLPAVPALLALLAAGIGLVAGRERMLGGIALAASLAWGAGIYAALWSRQLTSAWLTGALGREALLGRLLPESYPALRGLAEVVPPGGRVWLVWTRGYTYYLDRPYRLDSVFEGWRFEALVESAPSPEAFQASLRAEGFTHVLVNRTFFLEGTNADTEPGRTARLRARFAALLAAGALVEQARWGPVTLLRVGG